MRIVNQDFAFVDSINGNKILKKLEATGRVCYKSEDKITEDSAQNFVRNLIKRGHESVLEHVSITVKIITDRGISHEIVRHRLASYSQESTRYCNYKDKEIEFVLPYDIDPESSNYEHWELACMAAENSYKTLVHNGVAPQTARSVLPNCLKTELVMTCNLREWRHFFKLRCAPGAHPDMKYLATIMLHEFQEKIPVIFDDIEGAML